jgi:MFS family permease
MGLVLTASAAGTVFEWYDFFIFGSLLSIITRHFFAAAGETQGYIFALLTFAVGFAVRPFGGLVFGYFGDRTGRKRAFLFTITIMGVATFAIGLLPDTSTLGDSAPYLLIALRVLQGFAVGGELDTGGGDSRPVPGFDRHPRGSHHARRRRIRRVGLAHPLSRLARTPVDLRVDTSQA